MTTVMGDIEWQRAACRSHDPDMWFPPESGPNPVARLAKRICRSCPIVRECGEYAIRHGNLMGIWDGLTQTDRKHEQLRRLAHDRCVS